MSIDLFMRHSPVELTFGHFSSSHEFRKVHHTRKFAIAHNVLNTLDWLPLIGIISGLARCIITGVLSVKYKQMMNGEVSEFEIKQIKKWLGAEAIRGAVSTLGLGFLMIVPDILFDLHRYTMPNASQQPESM